MTGPYLWECAAPAVHRPTVLTLAGVRGQDESAERLFESCLAEAAEVFCYRVCAREGKREELDFLIRPSAAMQAYFADCDRGVLFVATVGLGIDRLVAKYSALSPARAVMLQALGAERVEALCDEFCRQLSAGLAEGERCRNRFSPGYGDLPLAVCPEIFRLLDCPRLLGVTLCDSFLMSPTKSVSAVVGIGRKG